MKILLINPLNKEGFAAREEYVTELYPFKKVLPFSLPQIAAELREAHKIKIIDANAEEISEIKLIKKWDYDIIITFVSSNLDLDSELKSLRKGNEKGIITIMVVNPPTSSKNIMKKNDFIDYSVYAEREFVIPRLVEFLERKRKISLVPGIFFRNKKGEIKKTKRPLEYDLKTLNLPAYDLLNLKKYDYGIIRPSKGCHNACTFCYWGCNLNKVRYMSLKHTIKSLQIIERYSNIKELHFNSHSFFYNKNEAKKILREMINKKIKIRWTVSVRADAIDKEILNLIKRTSCYRLDIGIESASEKMLGYIKKNEKIEEIIKILKLIHKKGLLVYATFIIGFPEDDNKTINETKSFIKKYYPKYISRIGLCILRPTPLTPLMQIAKREGLIKSKDYLSLSHGNSSTTISTKYISEEEVKKHYDEIKKIIKNRGFLSIYWMLKKRGLIETLKRTKDFIILKIKQKQRIFKQLFLTN